MERSKYKNILRKKRAMRHRKHIEGTQVRPRLNVFRSLKHISGQLINDEEGKTLCTVSSVDSKVSGSFKGSKVELAGEVGKRIAEKAKELGIERVYFDIGPYKYHGRVKALAEKVLESGVKF